MMILKHASYHPLACHWMLSTATVKVVKNNQKLTVDKYFINIYLSSAVKAMARYQDFIVIERHTCKRIGFQWLPTTCSNHWHAFTETLSADYQQTYKHSHLHLEDCPANSSAMYKSDELGNQLTSAVFMVNIIKT